LIQLIVCTIQLYSYVQVFLFETIIGKVSLLYLFVQVFKIWINHRKSIFIILERSVFFLFFLLWINYRDCLHCDLGNSLRSQTDDCPKYPRIEDSHFLEIVLVFCLTIFFIKSLLPKTGQLQTLIKSFSKTNIWGIPNRSKFLQTY